MTPNIYVYKCVVDDGTAPCIDRSLLSMTVCKPKVRTSAKVGDIVIAFGTNAQPVPNRLVYAASITPAACHELKRRQPQRQCSPTVNTQALESRPALSPLGYSDPRST